MKKVLLIGIGGVYNYGCEAIVRGTERILHSWYPEMQVCYASPAMHNDRRRLGDCPVHLLPRYRIGRYHPKNLARKALGTLGIQWIPMRDRISTVYSHDAVFSIGGDLYTLQSNGIGPDSLIKFGDACMRRGIPYVLWAASVGPFGARPRFEARVAGHLAGIHLITAREEKTVQYLKQNGVEQNVVRCADPAFVVAPDIVSRRTGSGGRLRIGINLSPLSVIQCGFTLQDAARRQADAIRKIMDIFKASVVLLPHVVCDHDEKDDDRRYLARIRDLMPQHCKARTHLVDDDPGFIGIKHAITDCDLVIAARMHCAINAVSARVPSLTLAYSSKASGMGKYIYGDDTWTLPLVEFHSDALINRVSLCLGASESFRRHIPLRLAQIRAEAYGAKPPL